MSSPKEPLGYDYDFLGRKTRTYTGGDPNDPVDEWTYSYDSLSRLASVTHTRRNGQPVDIFLNEGIYSPLIVEPESTRYHYDLLGNLDWQVSDQIQWIKQTEGSLIDVKVVTDYTYDVLNRLDSVRQFVPLTADLPLVGSPIGSFDYELRADGKRTGVSESIYLVGESALVLQTNEFEWQYDSLGRLVEETYETNVDELISQDQWPFADEAGTRSIRDYHDRYAFDLAGNRMTKTTDYDLLTTAADEAITYL